MNEEEKERVIKIEMDLAHLEKMVEELNEVVSQQARTIQNMEIIQRRLAQTVETMEGREIRETNSKPPHYQA